MLLKCCVVLCAFVNWVHLVNTEEECFSKDGSCSGGKDRNNKYSKEINEWTSKINKEITLALEHYVPCEVANCNCHRTTIENDLLPFKNGISKELFHLASTKGTKYQIFEGKVYRSKDCHFPARCEGIEHYLKALAPKLPNMELAINTRDWPQINSLWGNPKAPVLSFSKTKDYYDIMYPAWSFWEGGPAISLYPTGIGRWDKHRTSISAAADKWPWEAKKTQAFFRGSRTNEERDSLILLSRSHPDLVDAAYTKNQAWKSDAAQMGTYKTSKKKKHGSGWCFHGEEPARNSMDTLYAPPASEVSFEDHCKYKYLFNYRGVAASFRFKHLFLCKSLVFHVGDEWLEFFYPSLQPWIHYIPISPKATQDDIKKYIEFFKENDSLARVIANRGFQHIWDNLTDKDVKCYWKKLLKAYTKLVNYEIEKDKDLILV